MEIKELLNRTIKSIYVGDETYINCTDGSEWRFYHEQDCCESVALDEKVSLNPITPCTILDVSYACETGEESWGDTWTRSTYSLVTSEGPMILVFHGQSNGYYSEDVCLQRKTKGGVWRSFYWNNADEYDGLKQEVDNED